MRTSVVLICAVGLALSLAMVLSGTRSRTGIHAEMPQAATPAVVGTRTQEAQTTFAISGPTTVVTDTQSLLQQIQAGLNSNNPGDQAAIFTNQFLALIHANPWAAARFAESAEAGGWHTELMRVLAQNWAELNLPDAGKWVAQIANPDERDTMLSCVCFQVAQTDPKLAVETLEQQGTTGDRRQMMLGNLAQQWAAQDLLGAVSWAANFPPGDIRDNLFARIAMAESQSSPVQAAQTVAEQIPPGPAQEDAAINVLHEWALQDFPGATAWAEQFPTPELHNRANNELTSLATYQASLSSTNAPAGLQQSQ
jgi:hypothetical protein